VGVDDKREVDVVDEVGVVDVVVAEGVVEVGVRCGRYGRARTGGAKIGTISLLQCQCCLLFSKGAFRRETLLRRLLG